MSALVIIGCGMRKLDVAAPAGELYVGAHFRATLATAIAIADRADVLVLSAKHGLLSLDELVEPYDLTMGQPGAVSVDLVAAQAAARGLLGRDAVALCSARYVAVLAAIWPDVETPLAGLGIGHQRHELAVMRAIVNSGMNTRES